MPATPIFVKGGRCWKGRGSNKMLERYGSMHCVVGPVAPKPVYCLPLASMWHWAASLSTCTLGWYSLVPWLRQWKRKTKTNGHLDAGVHACMHACICITSDFKWCYLLLTCKNVPTCLCPMNPKCRHGWRPPPNWLMTCRSKLYWQMLVAGRTDGTSLHMANVLSTCVRSRK